jgi:drug/metabolite transporter (DMT)-like permease
VTGLLSIGSLHLGEQSLIEQFLPVGFSLAAVSAWGTSDFLGGYAARRANAFALTTIAHGSGMLLMTVIALTTHAPFPSPHAVKWALLAGSAGGTALAIFYRALASGKMGLTAPVSAVLGAGIPTAFAIFTEGVPGNLRLLGFALAVVGIWLISRSGDGTRAEGTGMAVLAGVGFAGFFMAIKQAGEGSALWIAVWSRVASFVLTGLVVLQTRSFDRIDRRPFATGVVAGILDISGSILFVRASQLGRLDTAVVLTSLYPVITVLYARVFLKEKLTRWKTVGMVAALAAVPLIAV